MRELEAAGVLDFEEQVEELTTCPFKCKVRCTKQAFEAKYSWVVATAVDEAKIMKNKDVDEQAKLAGQPDFPENLNVKE